MIISLLSSIIKLVSLIYLVSLERVIGLPWIYLLLSLIWIDQIQTQRNKFKLILISLFFSLLLSATYDLAWSLSLGLYTFSLLYLKFGQKFVKNQRRRFIMAVIVINLIITWVSSIKLSYLSLIQFIFSYLLVILWMRVFKIEQVKKSQTLNIKLINEKN